jgi:hypothetical protein
MSFVTRSSNSRLQEHSFNITNKNTNITQPNSLARFINSHVETEVSIAYVGVQLLLFKLGCTIILE